MNGLHKFRILIKAPIASPNNTLSGLTRLFSATGSAIDSRNDENLCELAKRSRHVLHEAQTALLEYFNSTRGLQFLDAENMSKNAPQFFDALTSRVVVQDAKIGRTLTRFLRYHPINEFEPFFESIGLVPSEYAPLLPRNLMFLNEDQLLLENYKVLCEFGIPRNRIGKIYREATEAFRFKAGELKSRIESFRKLELKQSLLAKIIAASPCLLTGKMELELSEFLRLLKKLGITHDWLEENLSVSDSYDWGIILELVAFLSYVGLNQDLQRKVLMHHPCLLLELSGRATFSLCGFLYKFGCTLDDIQNTFLHFPNVSVLEFATKFRNCYMFLVELSMETTEIGRIARSQTIIMGSCEMKAKSSLLGLLNCGKARVCEMLKENPELLEKWALHVRVKPIQAERRVLRVRTARTDFLLSLGFKEKSKEMESLVKRLRGNGAELQERFDCLLLMGLRRDEALQMVTTSPEILNQSKELIEAKARAFVELGYRASDMLMHSRVLSYKVERMKLRLLMSKWFKEHRPEQPELSLSTLMASSEKKFVGAHVNGDPKALAHWERLKTEIYSSAPEAEEKAVSL